MSGARIGQERDFRIEHRDEKETRPLGEISERRPTVFLLDPWVSRLRHKGATGELVLVDKGTGELVARVDLAAPPRFHAATRQRAPLAPAVTVAMRGELAALRLSDDR
jgi:hypothetical protein